MNAWKQVESVSLEGIAYNGPALIRQAEDQRGVYTSILTAVIPLDQDGDDYLPFVHGVDKGGHANFYGSERFYRGIRTAKRYATMKLQAQAGI